MKARTTLATLLALAAFSAVGAGAVSANEDPALGATVEAYLYADEDRVFSVINRSNVEAEFALEPSGGWVLEPTTVVLGAGEQADLQVVEVGEDAAPVEIRVVATAEPPPGVQTSELLLTSTLYLEAPFSWLPWILGGIAALLASLVISIGTARLLRRRRRELDDRRRWMGRVAQATLIREGRPADRGW